MLIFFYRSLLELFGAEYLVLLLWFSVQVFKIRSASSSEQDTWRCSQFNRRWSDRDISCWSLCYTQQGLSLKLYGTWPWYLDQRLSWVSYIKSWNSWVRWIVYLVGCCDVIEQCFCPFILAVLCWYRIIRNASFLYITHWELRLDMLFICHREPEWLNKW